MSEKEKNAKAVIKWCSIICGIGEVACGVLMYIWNKDTLNAAIFVLDGLFKFSIGYGLNELFGKEKSPSNDEDDEQE